MASAIAWPRQGRARSFCDSRVPVSSSTRLSLGSRRRSGLLHCRRCYCRLSMALSSSQDCIGRPFLLKEKYSRFFLRFASTKRLTRSSGNTHASQFESLSVAQVVDLGNFPRKKKKKPLSHGPINKGMAKRGAQMPLLVSVIGQHFGLCLSLSQRLWRLCTQATSKQQVDVGSAVKEEGADVLQSYKATSTTSLSQSSENSQGVVLQLEDIQSGDVKDISSVFFEGEFLRKVALVSNADAAMAMILQMHGDSGRVLTVEECSQLIQAALAENNADLAFSILNSMRSSQIQRRVELVNRGDRYGDYSLQGWRWPQPDVRTYIPVVRGLAAALRVKDAIQVVGDVKRRGIPTGDEVPFGKVIKCPVCYTALAVVQPHHGVQLVPCSKCRYQYELMSADVANSESESISMNISAFERGLRVLQLKRQPLPAAVHSFVVRSPSGLARTLRFATGSADVPAQQGERVTVVSAAPPNSGRGVGPLKRSARTPGWRPSEPMSMTNHVTGCVTPLIRAPPQPGSGAALDASVIIPAAFLLASSDAATALIDPTLPRAIAISAAAAAVLGTAANALVLPRLNQLPERTADAIALRQQLLAQYEALQSRLQDLTQGADEEVRMLSRMCQLQNKMEAVREPTYSARMERVSKAREGLDERLAARLELIDSYAKISSMIEIEVELDVDVLAAEAGGAVASIAEQIERLIEVENLQKQWRMQAEVNDELERLLQSSPVLPE